MVGAKANVRVGLRNNLVLNSQRIFQYELNKHVAPQPLKAKMELIAVHCLFPATYVEADASPVVVFNAAARTPPSNLINGDINLSTSQPSRPSI